MLAYHRPTTTEEALALLPNATGTVSLYAGGTDLLPRWTRGIVPWAQTVVDLKRVHELRGVARDNGEICIGACTAMSDIESNATIREHAPVLAEAAARIACSQIRSRGTIGGNLCNASPAADTAVPLILLDATLELARLENDKVERRTVPIVEFFKGPGSTALASAEILTHIRVASRPSTWLAKWDKFGTRPSMEIAVASVGLALDLSNAKVQDVRIGYGSVAPTPLRGRAAEEVLKAKPLTEESMNQAVDAAKAEISPISDVRASESYRRQLVGVMLRRMLERARNS